MATITNKTATPLKISLPAGKTLRLGPLKSAEITPKAAAQSNIAKLVEAGTVELIGGAAGGKRSYSAKGAQPSAGGGPKQMRKSGGDR